MCCSCGCRWANVDHGDSRNIVMSKLADAAVAGGIPIIEVAGNLLDAAVWGLDPAGIIMANLNRKTVSLDLDNTLCMWSAQAIAMLNSHFGTSYVYDDFDRYKIEGQIPDEQVKWLVGQWKKDSFNATLAPDTAAIKAVQALKDVGYRIAVVSDRPADQERVSAQWCVRWGVPADELFFEGPGSKVMFAERHSPADPVAFVDDNPLLGDKLIRPGVDLYLLRRPWTGDTESRPGLYVVDDMKEVGRRLPGLRLDSAVYPVSA